MQIKQVEEAYIIHTSLRRGRRLNLAKFGWHFERTLNVDMWFTTSGATAILTGHRLKMRIN